MAYQLAKHTADVRLSVSAGSVADLFTESVRGLMEFIQPWVPAAPGATRSLSLQSSDQTSLLVDCLNELLSQSHVSREVVTAMKINKLTETDLEAEVTTIPVSSFAEDVKAVTYHEAEVTKTPTGWKVTLVLDI